jgi:hypothetical protein
MNDPAPVNESIEVLRSAAAQRVEDTSLRGAAREIGMSPTGLKKFLLGTAPYSPTLRRLRRWYVHFGSRFEGTLTEVDADVCLTILTQELPPHLRSRARGLAVNVLCMVYDEAGKPRPQFLADIIA